MKKYYKYVLGFAFVNTCDGTKVVLIRKNRPEHLAGKLNGVGGKMKAGEPPKAAMIREFAEETGVETVYADWHRAGFMSGPDYRITVYVTETPEAMAAMTVTDEEIEIVPLSEAIHSDEMDFDARYLMMMALTKDIDKFSVNRKC